MTYLQSSAGTASVATATVTLKKGEEVVTDAATGHGPVDAVINSIDRICGVHGKVQDYRLRAVSHGRDALGEVSLQVKFDSLSKSIGGKGLSTDIIEASANAYLDAVNRLSYEQDSIDFSEEV
jgi:2-isopropylmalate synthase